MGDKITVYDCRTQKEQISQVAQSLDRPEEFNQKVLPWLDGCKEGERYHFVYRDNGQIQGWMMVDILTHQRKWTYAYLDKVSVRNGTKGVGKALGEYLKTWAAERKDIDFIWLWAIDERVSNIYQEFWGYKRVQYYDSYGFMYFPIKTNPPLSMLQQELPENPRIYWVGADAVAKMTKPPNNLLLERISRNRRGDVEPVRLILANLMDELPNLDEDGVKDVQDQLIKALPPARGGGKTARNTHRLRFFRKHHLVEKGYSVGELAKISKVSSSILQKVYDRGIGAYKTNPTSVRMKGTFKKGVNAPYKMKLSKEQWAMARVYSFLDGNPKHDGDLRRKTRRSHK